MQGGIYWIWLCDICRYIAKKVKLHVLHYFVFVCREGFYLWKYLYIGFLPWPSKLIAFGLIQLELALILV